MTAKERNVLERVEGKLDEIMEMLLDPDQGLYIRVHKNTTWRRVGQWYMGIMTTALITGLIYMIFFNQGGQ